MQILRGWLPVLNTSLSESVEAEVFLDSVVDSDGADVAISSRAMRWPSGKDRDTIDRESEKAFQLFGVRHSNATPRRSQVLWAFANGDIEVTVPKLESYVHLFRLTSSADGPSYVSIVVRGVDAVRHQITSGHPGVPLRVISHGKNRPSHEELGAIAKDHQTSAEQNEKSE